MNSCNASITLRWWWGRLCIDRWCPYPIDYFRSCSARPGRAGVYRSQTKSRTTDRCSKTVCYTIPLLRLSDWSMKVRQVTKENERWHIFAQIIQSSSQEQALIKYLSEEGIKSDPASEKLYIQNNPKKHKVMLFILYDRWEKQNVELTDKGEVNICHWVAEDLPYLYAWHFLQAWWNRKNSSLDEHQKELKKILSRNML